MLRIPPRWSLAALISLLTISLVLASALSPHGPAISAAAIDATDASSYSVLSPLQSGELTLFPVVSKIEKPLHWRYLTLDEGLRSGEVVVTEAGKARGLVRSRQRNAWPAIPGDAVNSLVLLNNSDRPLILLAGEILTGGKQDRVIAKDRIVPSQSDPVDLSVFCIEPGRWVESSATFGAAGKLDSGFMVQPAVRREAMAAQDQQRVWAAVAGAVSNLAVASASVAVVPDSRPPDLSSPDVIDGGPTVRSRVLTSTSYAKAMQEKAVGRKIDETGESLLRDREQILSQLRQEKAVGVVVAVRGRILWADIFADTEMLDKYWTKLIRSYAAEVLTADQTNEPAATTDQAQRFIDSTSRGHETSEGESGVYRYSEIRTGDLDSFALETLLPGTGFNVHVSKLRIENSARPAVIRWR